MAHIAEAELHAWLDGAIPEGSRRAATVQSHLDSCDECRDRLAVAREVIGLATELLASATPAGRQAPTVESLRARAITDGPVEEHERSPLPNLSPRRGRWRSLERLAWAASLVLAVGAGWIGREVLLDRGWTDPFHAAPTGEIAELAQSPGEEAFESRGGAAPAEDMRIEAAPGRGDARRGAAPVVGESLLEAGEADEAEPVEKRNEAGQRQVGVTDPVKEAPAGAVPGPDAVVREVEQFGELGAKEEAAAATVPLSNRAWKPSDPEGCFSVHAEADAAFAVPGVIEIRRHTVDEETEARLGSYRDAGSDAVHRVSLVPFADDSIWVSLPAGDRVLTLRLAPGEEGWVGTMEASPPRPGEPAQLRRAALRSAPCAPDRP